MISIPSVTAKHFILFSKHFFGEDIVKQIHWCSFFNYFCWSQGCVLLWSPVLVVWVVHSGRWRTLTTHGNKFSSVWVFGFTLKVRSARLAVPVRTLECSSSRTDPCDEVISCRLLCFPLSPFASIQLGNPGWLLKNTHIQLWVWRAALRHGDYQLVVWD